MEILSSKVLQSLNHGFFKLYPDEAARLLNTLADQEILKYLEDGPITQTSKLFSLLNPETASQLIEYMSEDFFIQIITNVDSAFTAHILSRLDDKRIKKLLDFLPATLSYEIKELMEYHPETAGYIMDTQVISFYPDDSVGLVLNKIRTIQGKRINSIYVIDSNGILEGVIPLQEVAVAQLSEKLKDLIKDKPIAINSMAPQEEIIQLLENKKLQSIPVIDIHGKLLGIIRYDALLNVAKQDASVDLQAMFGAGREERALSKVMFAVSKRLPWLQINLATAFLASFVVSMFEDTIAQITALAIFLPVVAGQSGNTGSQALAVTMRALALREIRTRHWFTVARKELMVGFINGCAVSLITSVIVFFWVDSFGLAVVIGISMIISMVIAGFSGAVIPILLKALGQDPAQSSSIILTTVTDIVGFLSFLGLASLLATALNII